MNHAGNHEVPIIDVTIVICTWNRVALLEQTLRRLEALRIPAGLRWEVLVVDNNSTDSTAAFLSAFRPSYPLRVLHEGRAGKSNALNLALSTATSDLILLTDDDVLVDPDWLAEFWDGARRHPAATVLGGPIEPWFVEQPDPDLLIAFPLLRRGFAGIDYGGEEGPLPTGSDVVGANMALRRSKLKGLSYRPDLGPTGSLSINGEEMELQRLVRQGGGSVVWLPAMRLKHYVEPARMELRSLLKLSEDWGRMFVRRYGVPAGPRVAGVPRWIVREVVSQSAQAWRDAARGRRSSSLDHRRRRQEFVGMIKECLSSRRARVQA